MGERVFTADERSFDDVQHVGIAITSLRNVSGQQHVGILHKDGSTDEVRVLHLAWHFKLKNSQPKPSYAWIDPPILGRRAKQVAASCRRIFRANSSGIPYAFSQYIGCFDEQTGEFLDGIDRKGLTCASFVLAVFHLAGLPLIQPDTWPVSRDGDDEWQSYIIEQLKNKGATLDHISGVESEKGTIRYRPEDVAGAGAAQSVPASFVEVSQLSRKILKKLNDNSLFT